MLKLLMNVKTLAYLGDPVITRMCAPRHMRSRLGIHIADAYLGDPVSVLYSNVKIC
jgi:hypothetical protein